MDYYLFLFFNVFIYCLYNDEMGNNMNFFKLVKKRQKNEARTQMMKKMMKKK
jgi:hypothetical protein